MNDIIVIDTNAAIDLLNAVKPTIMKIEQYQIVQIPAIVIGELRLGAYKSAKPSQNLVKVDSLEMRCRIINIDARIADWYGVIRHSLLKKGKPIPENDIWISACCKMLDAPIMTNDQHYHYVDGLKIVNF